SADSEDQTAAAYIGMFFLMLVPFLLPGLIGGLGLLRLKPWARIVLIILSAILLLEFPIGTALGGFGLWVLLSRAGQAVFAAGPVSPGGTPAPLPSSSLKHRNLLADPVFGLLAAMFVVAAGFVLVLAIGFRSHGETAPAGIDSAAPAAGFVVLVAA